MPSGSTEQVPGHARLHSDTTSQKQQEKRRDLRSLSRNIAPEEEKSRKLRKISEDAVSASVSRCLWADPVRNRVSMTQKTTEFPS